MSASEIERLVIVPIDKPLRGGAPDDRIMAGTVFYHFLNWVLPCLPEYLKNLQARLLRCNAKDNPRLQKSGEMLLWAGEMFLEFAMAIRAINEGEKEALMEQAAEIVGQIVSRQIHMSARAESRVVSGTLAHYILKGYNDKAFSVTKKKKAQPYQDAYVESETLYIPLEVLLRYLSTTPYCYLTEKTLGKELRKQNLLPKTQEQRTTAKGKGGRRYIRLPFSVLKQHDEVWKPERE